MLWNSKKMWMKSASASGVCCRTTHAPPRGEGPAVGLLSRWLGGWDVDSGGKIRPMWTLSVV